MSFSRPRGTRDFSPDETGERRQVLEGLREVLEGAGYREIQTPIFEETGLFTLKSGVEITKHLYDFKDKGDRNICLRPEGTASVARLYNQELRGMPKPLRMYYHGPMYRYERPQKNRYREFFQTGVELIGSDSVYADVEAVWLASQCMNYFNLKHTLRLNHLGVLKALLSELGMNEDGAGEVISLIDRGQTDEVKEKVSSDAFKKLVALSGGKEVLEKAEKVLSGHEKALEKLSEFNEICEILDRVSVGYTINFGVARGLDYYTGLIFDVKVDGLGAQDQICGGGRYDNLVELFDGPATPAVGFAFGFDRLMDALQSQGFEFEKPCVDIIVATIGDVNSKGFEIASNLRESLDAVVEYEMSSRSIGKTFAHASEIGVRYVVVVGEKELKDKTVGVKDLAAEKQEDVKLDELADYFIEKL